MNHSSSISRRTRFLLVLLATLLVLSTFSVIPINAAQTTQLDYSNPESGMATESSASAFVSLLVGSPLSQAEQTYLDTKFGDDIFKYSTFVPSENVTTEYEGKALRVNAKVYSYTAVNGTTITWSPTSATVGEYTLDMTKTSGGYTALFNSVDITTVLSVQVKYSCNITISSDIAGSYINYAYNDAFALWEKNRDHVKYLKDLEAYNAYLKAQAQYQKDLLAWQKYIEDKKQFEFDKVEYQEYLKHFAAYETELKKYNAYLEELRAYNDKLAAYEKYLSDLATFDERYRDYQIYITKFEKAKSILVTVDSMFSGKSLYATLMGGTVDMVLDPGNQELLIAAGVSPTMLAQADEATTTLKSLLSSYSNLDSVTDKYNFYYKNYNSLLSSTSNLYGALHSFISDSSVKNAIMSLAEEKGKLERYLELVAQLYVVCTALDDSTTRDENWSVTARYTNPVRFVKFSFYDLIDNSIIVDDTNNANPSSLGELGAVLHEPETPVEVEKPTSAPTPVAKPIEPDIVIEPIEPTFVAEPIAPTEVADPGEAPEVPSFTAIEVSLINAIEDSTLKRREVASSYTISMETSVSAHTESDKISIVTFYNHDGSSVLYEYLAERGSQIVYGGKEPSRESTAQYDYKFIGWKTADKQDAVLGTADTAKVAFYAGYESTVRSYTVTFIVENEKTTQTLLYGETPQYNGIPTKESDGEDNQNIYSFAYWSPAIAPVTGDVTYVAIFSSSLVEYVITWDMDGYKTIEFYEYGTKPVYPGKYDITVDDTDSRYIRVFSHWDKTISPVTENETYTAQFKKEAIASNGVTALDIKDTNFAYIVSSDTNSIKIENLISLALKNNRSVELNLGNIKLQLNKTLLADLQKNECTEISVSYVSARAANGTVMLQISFKGKNGEFSPAYPITIITDCNGKVSENTVAYTTREENGETLKDELPVSYDKDNNTISVKCTGNATICFRDEFALTMGETPEGEQSPLITLPTSRGEGDIVTLAPRFADGYVIKSLVVKGASGTEYDITKNDDGTYTFVMPNESIEVFSTLELREYTVRFVVDGVEILVATYHKGDTVVLPEPPTKEQEGDIVYKFDSWSPTVTTVTSDVTYTAVFTSAPIGGSDTYIPQYDDSFNYVKMVLIIFFVLVVIGLGVLAYFKREKLLPIWKKIAPFFKKFFDKCKELFKKFIEQCKKLPDIFKKWFEAIKNKFSK